MKDRPRIIKPKPPKGYPDVVVCVQAAIARTFNSESDELGSRHLAAFHAVMLTKAADGYTQAAEWDGKGPAEFWRYVYSLGAGIRSCWIVSANAREHCTILGLWDQVSDGHAMFRAPDDPRSGEKGKQVKTQQDGLVVLAAPPTIVGWLRPKDRCRYTWIDPANFGCCVFDDKPTTAINDAVVDGAFEPSSWENPETVTEHARAVCRWFTTLARCLIGLEFKELGYTAALTAHNEYLRTYMPRPITLHDNAEITQMERDALYGGRVECRFLGGIDGPIYHLDANSLYPFCAAVNDLPCELEGDCPDVPIDRLVALCKRRCVIARVRVKMREPAVPCRLTIDRQRFGAQASDDYPEPSEGRETVTIFPVGEFTTTLCGPELLLAASMGRIKSCERAVWYTGARLYGDWVNRLWGERQRFQLEGKDAMASTCKAMLNSPFGKWGQRSLRWVPRPEKRHHLPYDQWTGKDAATGERHQWRSLGWAVQQEVKSGEHPDSFPAILAYITSLGRCWLWRALQTARLENVYYYDTDSLWVNDAGNSRLQAAGLFMPFSLGGLKEVAKHERVDWYGIRRYVADGKLTMAGADVRNLRLSRATVTAAVAKPLDYYLRASMPPGIDATTYVARLAQPYLHGIPQRDGTIRPHRLAWQESENTLANLPESATMPT